MEVTTPTRAFNSANLTVFTAKCFLQKPQFLILNPSTALRYSRNKKLSFLLTHCSTKPNTNKENTTDQDLSSSEPTPNSRFQRLEKTTSTQALSSNSSSLKGLVFDLGLKNSWDSLQLGSPVVKRYLGDEEERWYMWYHGRSIENPGSDSIGLAVSSNGIHWERGGEAVRSNADVGLVINCSNDWWAFDTHSVRPSEIVIMSSNKVRANNAVYWLYYTGFNSEKIESFANNSFKNSERMAFGIDGFDENDGDGVILKSLPGLAMSQDGRHWARIEGEHHSGALLDVGSEGEWDSLFISSPQVVFHGSGDLRMYYHSFDVEKGHFAVGLARSRDGMRWVKLGKIIGGGGVGSFDEGGIVNARVVRNRKDGKYVMVYEGVGANGKRSVGVAISSDGLKEWRRLQEGPVFKQSENGGWDCEGVGMPCLVQMDGENEEWRLYYRGFGVGGRTGIGLAVCEGSFVNNFLRWTGFHL